MEIRMGHYMIRDLQEGDAPSIAKYANNPKMWINLRDVFPHPYHLTDAKEFLTQVMQNEPRVVFAIATQDEVIGTIGLTLGTDVHRFTAELGYWLAEPFWNKGIMTSAVKKLSDYAFDHFSLYRIYAEPYTTNPASARVLEKAGFNREGILRSSAFKDGRVLDQWLYAKVRRGKRGQPLTSVVK